MTRQLAFVTVAACVFFGAAYLSAQPRFAVQKDGLQPPGYDQYFTSIMAAVNSASSAGTLIKVFPSNTAYEEKVVINKDIRVEGSGAEATLISWQKREYAVEVSAGKLLWFSVTSQLGGVKVSTDGMVSNCVAYGCSGAGFDGWTGGKIVNCVSTANGYGFRIYESQDPIILNCIAYKNTNYGFYTEGNWSYSVEFCNSFGHQYNYAGTNYNRSAKKQPSSLESDPVFVPSSWAIAASSPSKDTGSPAYRDPDSTPVDMGYYGGPDAPTFPVIIKAVPTLNPDGTITIEATGVSRY